MKLHTKLIGALLAFASPFASAAIIDFEGFSAGTIIDNEYSSTLGVTIEGYNLDRSAGNLGVVFDTNNFTGEDSDLASPFSSNNGLGPLNPGNVLIIHETPSECNSVACTDPDDEGSRPSGYFNISFSELVTLNSVDFFDVENPEAQAPANRIELFGANNTQVFPNTFFSPNTGGDNKWDRLDFGVAGISRVKIHLGGSGAIDNINFTAVSEPGMWLFLVFGLAMLRCLRARQSA